MSWLDGDVCSPARLSKQGGAMDLRVLKKIRDTEAKIDLLMQLIDIDISHYSESITSKDEKVRKEERKISDFAHQLLLKKAKEFGDKK